MKQEYKQSVAFEEIKNVLGSYKIVAVVEEDFETFSLLKNPFIIALKCTIKQNGRILGVGRANSILSPSNNKFLKNAVLYCWKLSITDGVSKSLKVLNSLMAKESPEANITDSNNSKYASDKQKTFLKKLVYSKCKDGTKKEYEDKLESPYLSSFECSSLIKTLLTK